MIAMLLLMAAPAEHAASVAGSATAHILPGARIKLVEQKVDNISAEPQRSRIVRPEAGQPRSYYLIEFQ